MNVAGICVAALFTRNGGCALNRTNPMGRNYVVG